MQTLLQRLESLTAPSRDVSDELLLSWGWEVDTEDHEGIIWKLPDGQLIAGEPHPTASIDDALLGVPEGSYAFPFPWFYSEYSKHEKNCVFWRAAVFKPIWEKATPTPAGDDWFERVQPEIDSPTPAIALCIAIVKARGGV